MLQRYAGDYHAVVHQECAISEVEEWLVSALRPEQTSEETWSSSRTTEVSNQVNQDQMSTSSSLSRPESLPVSMLQKEDRQASLKAQIREIQASTLLTPKEKAASVQNLMMKDWNDSRDRLQQHRGHNDSEADRVRPSYHDETNHVYGCAHYQRRCKLFGKCCGKWYPCRFCHDDNESHPFDRYAVEQISCMLCNTVQPISKQCVNEKCQTVFARYFCEVCKFFDDDPNKDIYHCDKCKICRIGKGLEIDYFHCDRCNACMSVSLKKHKCVERSLESDCPICHCFMFTSTTPVMFLPCGHCMHVACYEEYTLTNYVCPLCSKSLGDMEMYFASIDELLEREQMPPEYQDYKSLIYCCDCERKSTTSFHFIYHKCQHADCKSFNTKVLRQFKDSDQHMPTAGSETTTVNSSH